MPRKVTCQRVKSPAWRVHVIWALRTVQHGQHDPQLSGVVRLYTSLAPFSEKGLKSFVTKRLNHARTVNRQLTLVNPKVMLRNAMAPHRQPSQKERNLVSLQPPVRTFAVAERRVSWCGGVAIEIGG